MVWLVLARRESCFLYCLVDAGLSVLQGDPPKCWSSFKATRLHLRLNLRSLWLEWVWPAQVSLLDGLRVDIGAEADALVPVPMEA